MLRIPQLIVSYSLMVSMLACGSEPSAPHESPESLGTHDVGYLTFNAIDPAREDRTLVIDVWYPADAEAAQAASNATYPLSSIFGMESEVALKDVAAHSATDQPLLIFSHGYGGINRQSVELMEALASHGFIVASPEHTGNAQSSFTDSFDVAASNRVPDLSFVIDTMLERSTLPDDLFYNRIDANKVAALGHSFGGMTVIGSAAGWAGASADNRVKAIVPMSAVIDREIQEDERESDNGGFTPEQLASITIPTMLVGGTEDVSVPIENNVIAYEGLTHTPKLYMVDITGANHTHFTNVCAIGDFLIETGFSEENWANMGAADLVDPYNATCSEDAFPMTVFNRLLNLYVVSFFKLELMGDESYEKYLTLDFAANEEFIEFSSK